MYPFTNLNEIFSTLHELLFKGSEYPEQVARLRANWPELIEKDLLRINVQGLPSRSEVWVWDNAYALQERYLFTHIDTNQCEKLMPKSKVFQFCGIFEVTVNVHPHCHSSKLLEEFFLLKDYENDLERLRSAKKHEMEYKMLSQEYTLLCSILDLPVFI